MICESYYAAIRTATAEQIEAIDMGRRGVHNEAAEIVIERLKGKVEVDFATARRLFHLAYGVVLDGARRMSAGHPSSVLFACSLNAVRSPMAEGLARSILGQRIYVDSAGLSTEPLDPFAVAALAELGIDIRDHNTQGFDDIAVDEFDMIVALSREALERAQELTRHTSVAVEYWPTDDPTMDQGGSRESRMSAYRAVRDGLVRRIRERFGA